MSRRLRIAACSLSLLAGCSEEEPTEIVAGVSTQMRVPEGIKGVGLLVVGDGTPLFCGYYPVIDGTTTLPATLGVLRRTSGSLVTVTVLGFRTEFESFADNCFIGGSNFDAAADGEEPNEVVVVRRRRLPFLSDRILFLPLPLKESCNDTACSEDDGLTCVGGACVPMDIAAETLPEYQDSLIFGNTSTCFDPSLCMPRTGTLPVVLEDPEDCTFRAAWPSDEAVPSDGLNVRVLYSSMGSEILDLDSTNLEPDQHEGITLPDPDDSLRFRLAPNLCETNYKAGRILGLEASPFCPGKTPFQPICDVSLQVNAEDPDAQAIGGMSAAAKPGICTLASLTSVESAAYVLMDRSFDMYKFYGDGGLRFAVELPLSNPVARQTRMAFGLLPAAAPQCDVAPADNLFAIEPQIPFANVTELREPIGDLLGDPSNVLPDNPPVYMEAAMEGAYRALGELTPTSSTTFNRRALVVIGNRGYFETCATDGVPPAQRALAAFSGPDNIYTYAVVLENENDPDPIRSSMEVAEATAVALNGGTEVFDAVADETEGAAAVQKVLNDLGSCLYEVRSPLTGSPTLPADATLSYVDPLTPIRETIDIPRNAECGEDSESRDPIEVSGWSQDSTSNLVRICGQACNDLRDKLDLIAGVNALENRVAPSVPLIVSGGCPEDEVFNTTN